MGTKTIQDVEHAITSAMKEGGNQARVDSLRGLLNQIKLIAKNDGNRDPNADDVITAGKRIIKQNRETMSFLPEGDDRRVPLEAEIAVVSEFLPQQMSDQQLTAIIQQVLAGAPENSKSVRGIVMKHLNANYRGLFDAQTASTILGSLT